MGRFLNNTLEIGIVLICLPFYAVAVPALLLFEYLCQKRRVHLNLEVTHWLARDLREDYLVVDMSRTTEGLVGIRRRRWCVLRSGTAVPPYSETVEFINVKQFWVPHPLFNRSRA